MTLLYLADTSVWHRRIHPAVVERFGQWLAESAIATCSQVRLEVLYSARSAEDYDRLSLRLSAAEQLRCGEAEFERALEVQRMLAHRAALHHRSVTIADLLIAASAEAGGAVVWHYDEDFDRIADVTGQPIEWAAPRGSL